MSRNNEYYLKLKIATIQIASACGYDTSEDDEVLAYKPKDIGDYYKYALNTIESNAIRSILHDNGQLSNRSSLSTLYESKDRPNHFILICFLFIHKDLKQIGVEFVKPVMELCNLYMPSNQKYCNDCVKKHNKIKACLNCSQPQFCSDCITKLRCKNCDDEKLCNICINKMKKINIHNIINKKCGNCTKSDFCEACKSDQESSNVKNSCKDCKGELFSCEDCEFKKNFTKCEECPQFTFCNSCIKTKNITTCKNCPKAPQIIERCVLISEYPLTPDAKDKAAANIPRIKPNTGELISAGCLVQIYLDHELSYNPIIHSLGSRYYVMTTEETIKFFNNPDNYVTEFQIHQIDMHGTICKYFGLYPGQLLRIERDILVPGSMILHEIIYRIVRFIPIVRKNRRRGLKKTAQTNVSGAVDDDY